MDELKSLIREAHMEMIQKWDRMLPTSELFVDRWEKAKLLGFGEGTSVYDSCMVLGRVSVGENVWIGPSTLLDGSGGLSIGDNCHISAGVQVYSHDTVKRALSGNELEAEHAPTSIGHHCHIGAGSIILKGVSIGHHSVVGAGCVVTKSFPPFSIIAGVPGRKVGETVVGEDIEFNYEK